MIEMKTAYTLEVDDGEYALEEILTQLGLPHSQRAFSAGIMMFHPDYAETGTAQKIAEELPFDVVGCTTMANMTPDMDDSLLLSVSLYTSDDVRFSTFLVEDPQNSESIEKAYGEAKAEGKPGLITAFVSQKIPVSIEEVLGNMDKATGNAPIFGLCSVDHTSDLSACCVICNGKTSDTATAALAFWGDVDPVFCYSELNEVSTRNKKAYITKSDGREIIEVNDMSFGEYLHFVGFSKQPSVEELGGIPLLIDYCDGTAPVACGLQGLTEDGHGIVSIIVPEGATIGIGTVERRDVLRLTEDTLKQVIGSKGCRSLILFPCVSHYLVLNTLTQDQKEIIAELTEGRVPYHLAYAGGEICPAYDSDGVLHNRFHNYTFVACAL